MNRTIGPDTAVLDRAAGANAWPASVRAGLGDPVARIAVAAVTRAGVRRLDCYAVAGAAGQLAALTPNGSGEVEASFPVDGRLPEALIADTLGLGQALAVPDHRSDLDLPALWALAAMVDAHRQLELESLLARTLARRIALDEDTICLRALDGAALADPRWLSSMLTLLLGPGDVAEARLREGLAALARAGLATRDASGLWSPQPAFAEAFAHLEVPLAAVSLSIDRAGEGRADQAAMVLLRTIAALWMIEPRRSAGAVAGVSLRAIAPQDARRCVHDAIAPALAAATAAPPARAKSPGFCPQCGHPAAAGDRFCGQCGRKLA